MCQFRADGGSLGSLDDSVGSLLGDGPGGWMEREVCK